MGTWRLVSAKYGGRQNDLPTRAVTYKHVTAEGFMWLSYDKETGKVFLAAGCVYRLHGDTYIETVECGMRGDFAAVKNAEHAFTVKVEGNKWCHEGQLAGGLTIDEVWERLKPAEPSDVPEVSR